MNIHRNLLGRLYKIMYIFSSSEDKEKYLLRATSLKLNSKNFNFISDQIQNKTYQDNSQDKIFPSIRNTRLATLSTPAFPSKDGFKNNISLFLTARINR